MRTFSIDQFKNSYVGGGLEFFFKFKSIIPEIGGHALAEGSRLSVPAARKGSVLFPGLLVTLILDSLKSQNQKSKSVSKRPTFSIKESLHCFPL